MGNEGWGFTQINQAQSRVRNSGTDIEELKHHTLCWVTFCRGQALY
jgi:hypothetical protein